MELSGFEPNYLHLDFNGRGAPRWRGGKYHLESRTPVQAAV